MNSFNFYENNTTCPCNIIQRFYSAVKIENFIEKKKKKKRIIHMFIFLAQNNVVETRLNRFGDVVLTSTHNLCLIKNKK